MFKLIHFILKLLTISILGALTISSYAASIKDSLDDIASQAFIQDEPGASVIVLKQNKVLLAKGYGLANVQHTITNSPDTIFKLGSITKQFTAVATLMLIEQGKVKLTDNIAKYVPQFGKHGSKITVQQLLNHTSGVPDFTYIPEWSDLEKIDISHEEMLKIFKDKPLMFEPGTQQVYSNSGYYLLGMLIEKVSNMSYGDFIEQNIFKPLNMNRSYYGEQGKIFKNSAQGYMATPDDWMDAECISMTHPFSAGALLSTVSDLAKWHQALGRNKLISQESLRMAQSETTLKDGSKAKFSFGWYQDKIQGFKTIAHAGGISGFSTYELYLPEPDVYVAVLSNQDHSKNASYTAIRLAVLAAGKPYRAYQAQQKSLEALKSVEGVYIAEDEKPRLLTVKDGKLLFNELNDNPVETKPSSNNTYFFDDRLSFFEIIYDKNHPDSLNYYFKGEEKKRYQYVGGLDKLKDYSYQLTSSEIQQYLGTYQFGPDDSVKITTHDGKLYFEEQGEPVRQLLPESQYRFVLEGFPDIKFRFELSNHAVVVFVIEQKDQEYRAQKMENSPQ